MSIAVQHEYELVQHETYCSIHFRAMASSCEFLVETQQPALAHQLAQRGVAEVKRIEQKFSRYVSNNLCYAINNANGRPIEIDNECYRLLAYAQTCYELSDGKFDLTSGVLRRAWKFDGSDRIPKQRQIDAILPLVGWDKVHFDSTHIQMLAGMEVDFGGIGKEYAVSSVTGILQNEASDVSALINLGGDIQITQARNDGHPWHVGIENHQEVIPIMRGALATSGDSKRFLLRKGKRYSHILNPKTGWPVNNAPSSVTTHAPFCIQAGSLATLALLAGKDAEAFLKSQDVTYWCTRS